MIDMETLYSMAKEYENFSCKPKSCKYKAGTVFDEDKSVKWNKEEIDRLNKLHDNEVKELNTEKNLLYTNLVKEIKSYIVQETHVSWERAGKIYNYLCDKYHSYGFIEVLNHLDDLLDLFV